MEKTWNDYDPCSREEAEAVVGTGDWGEVNSLACDAYFKGQLDIMADGPVHQSTNRRFTKEEALAWIERVYG